MVDSKNLRFYWKKPVKRKAKVHKNTHVANHKRNVGKGPIISPDREGTQGTW